jgi:hypothetical protein
MVFPLAAVIVADEDFVDVNSSKKHTTAVKPQSRFSLERSPVLEFTILKQLLIHLCLLTFS